MQGRAQFPMGDAGEQPSSGSLRTSLHKAAWPGALATVPLLRVLDIILSRWYVMGGSKSHGGAGSQVVHMHFPFSILTNS